MGMSKTPKAHMIFAHIVPFYEETGQALGRISEQTFERMHSRWKEFARYRLRGELSDPQYGPALLKATQNLNVLYLS